jgi:hypothetical protein
VSEYACLCVRCVHRYACVGAHVCAHVFVRVGETDAGSSSTTSRLLPPVARPPSRHPYSSLSLIKKICSLSPGWEAEGPALRARAETAPVSLSLLSLSVSVCLSVSLSVSVSLSLSPCPHSVSLSISVSLSLSSLSLCSSSSLLLCLSVSVCLSLFPSLTHPPQPPPSGTPDLNLL